VMLVQRVCIRYVPMGNVRKRGQRTHRNNPGSLAIFAAIRRACSLLSNLAKERRPARRGQRRAYSLWLALLSLAALLRTHFKTIQGAVMTDDSGTSDLSSAATNGPSGDSASALSVRSNGVTQATRAKFSFTGPFDGAADKELSTVAKRFLIAEINRLVEENQQLKQFKEKFHELDKKLVVLEKYHDLDKKLVVLKETIKPFRRNLFLSSACLIAGAAGIA